MSFDRTRSLRNYLTPPGDAIWRWSEDGEAVIWPDGTTIAFRQELEEILVTLGPEGLPPMGAVVLLLGACREGWEQGLFELSIREQLGEFRDRISERLWNQVLDGLTRIASLPASMRNALDNKRFLASVVFEDAPHRTPPISAGDIRRAVTALPPTYSRGGTTLVGDASPTLLRDLRSLAPGLVSFDPDTLPLRRQTGLDTLPEPISLPRDDLRGLLEDLRDEEGDLSGLARLATRLMAAVTIPKRLASREDLPLGGFSDIANRGPLDRLLLSELAQDDLTLSVRIAVGEALYLRREAPPRNPPDVRAILVDTGIRLWGRSRLFATAVAFALSATAQPNTDIRVYRTVPGTCLPSRLSDRQGLADHLAELSPAPHPGSSLEPFFQRIEGTADSGLDAILVTHRRVLDDADFQPSLPDGANRNLFIAAVDESGAFGLYELGPRGRRLLRTASLDLETFLTSPPVRKRLEAEGPTSELPLLCRVDPFPLLLPADTSPRRARFAPEHGALSASRDGRLLHWKEPDRGPRQLTDRLPPGRLYWMRIDGDGTGRCLIGDAPREALHLVEVDLVTGDLKEVEIGPVNQAPIAVCSHGGVIFLVHRERVDLVDETAAALLESFPLPPHLRWQYDRFFFGESWYALHFDGLTAGLEPIHPKGRRKPGANWVLFDREGLDGPWAITPGGRILCLVDDATIDHPLSPPLSVMAISNDGHRIALRGRWRNETSLVLFDLTDGSIEAMVDDPQWMVEGDLARRTRVDRKPVTEFGACFVGRNDSLHLVSPEGFVWQLHIGPGRLAWEQLPEGSELAGSGFTSFEPIAPPQRRRYGLRVARLPGRARVFLDSRGLLHLVPPDTSDREIAVALFEGSTAAWTSDGRTFGDPFFYRGEGVDPSLLRRDLKRFVQTVRDRG